jgi:hypothetical protein
MESDEMGIMHGKHLHPPLIREASPTPDDHWPVCPRAIRYASGRRKGELVLTGRGEPTCYCECVDGNGRHRYDHDAMGTDRCVFCSESL